MRKFFGVGSNTGDATGTQDRVLQSLRGYWDAKRIGGALPSRASIDPRGMEDNLERVFLLERISKGNARFRLAGMQLNDLIGMDVRGMPITTFFLPEARDRIASELEAVFDAPAIVEVALEAERGLGRPAVSGRMLLLPLTNRDAEVEMALGCIVTEGSLGRAPRRFAISGVHREEVFDVAAEPPLGLRVVSSTPAQTRMQRPMPKPAPKLRLVSVQD